ncbi:MAG: sigma-70 family RNA polymerase sigma factor, partial [Bacteroidota bacterium]
MDDLPIIRRVLAGETEAFSQLIRRHQQVAFALAMSVLKHEADAKDATQQGFILAFTNLAKFKGQASFSSWLNRIVINEALRILRRKQHVVLEEWDVALPAVTTVPNEALRALQQEDRRKLIREVLARMPAREALVLQLFYLEDRSIKETAYSTGLKAN